MRGGLESDLSWMVTAFADNVAAVKHAVVVSSDGLPLAISDGLRPERLDQLSAITAGLGGLTRGAARMFDGGRVTQTVVEMSQATLIVMPISDGSALVVLAATEPDMGVVAYEMAMLTERVGRALTPRTRWADGASPRLSLLQPQAGAAASDLCRVLA